MTELFAELQTYSIPTHPNLRGHLLLSVADGQRRVMISGGTRAERDDAKIFLNEMLATGHYPPFEWLDDDDVTALQKRANEE